MRTKKGCSNQRNISHVTIAAAIIAVVMIVQPLGVLKAAPSAASVPPKPGVIVVQFGYDLPGALRARIEELLRSACRSQRLEIRKPTDPLFGLPNGAMLISIGDTTTSRRLIAPAELEPLGSEGFVVRSGKLNGRCAIATDGNPRITGGYRGDGDAGTAYGAYALLEELGFAFLHPLQPIIPDGIYAPKTNIEMAESPYWPCRGIHIHTMHPLELTNLLNGWGKKGPDDEEGWRSMLPEWRQFLEWLVANRQNRVEWVLLSSNSWKAFADSPQRQQRLAELVRMGHEWGIAVGIVAPLALLQQNAWRLVVNQGSLDDELAQIRSRIDWLMATGIDFLGTKMGTSEFTSTEDTRIVAWMNEAARYLDETYGKKRMYVKIHCSTDQHASNYTDPDTGEPLNYNFLPHYADPRVGVMPHSVQLYGLEDPAPTYNNTDFGYMREFLQEEAGAREVLWYPESSYWCAFDVDMPLFLPLYAERRLRDLRLIAADEKAGRTGRGEHAGERIQGQMLFSSGWEWSYWLNDVIGARAAWQPYADEPDHVEAFRKALWCVVRPFGSRAAELRELLIKAVNLQEELLIYGRVKGKDPVSINKRNGMAYLEGWAALDDTGDLLGMLLGKSIRGKPDRLQPVWLYNLFDETPLYAEVEPLLEEMERAFGALASEFGALRSGVPTTALPFLDEICDASEMTALRARQMSGLYDYIFHTCKGTDWRRARLENARQALDTGLAIARRRERSYRVERERIAGWGVNPTCYTYGYLWTAGNLWYWWRDEGKAVDGPLRPGYMNIINTVGMALGESPLNDIAILIRRLCDLFAPGMFELLGAPEKEPTIPPYDMRSRP